jgi:hypothetical protein
MAWLKSMFKGENMSKSRIATAIVVLALGFILGLAVNPLVSSFSRRALATAETPSAGTQGVRGVWEHRVIIRSIFSTEKQLERDLSQLGSEGFEVCGMTVKERDIVIVLRRPGK